MSTVKKSTSGFDEKIIWHGNHPENDLQVHLKAGSLSLVYENGAIRYISTGEFELIRMIYPAVRDRKWLTIKPLTKSEKIDKKEDSFAIILESHYQNPEVNFYATYIIKGNNDNSISFEMDGTIKERTVKNRIGLCVLHPLSGCAGINCSLLHTDGTIEGSFFPEEVSPHQVFKDIRSMSWLANGISCKLDFEGDIFETEDQRNWSDASYKTYSTPLSLPYPVTLEKDTRIHQRITFHAEGTLYSEYNLSDSTVVRLFPEETFRLPSIGISQSNRLTPLSKNEIKLLRAIRFDHYRTDLYLFESGWQKKAEKVYNESSDLGLPIEFALFFDDNAVRQVKSFTKWLNEKKPLLSSVLLFHKSVPSTPDGMASKVIPVLRETFPDIKIATGTNANFAQLNRNRPGETGNDRICYSIHPQEHASDNTTLIENIEAQGYIVRSARAFAGKKGIIVSPVTLQRRFNASISFYELPWTGTGVPPQVDIRMMSLLGASWTVGSIKSLSISGADSITYFETTGERGIIQGDNDPEWPAEFPSVKGMLFPVYYIFKFLLNNKSMNALKAVSSNPLAIECLALTDGKQGKVILVNFTSSSQPVMLECCAGLFRIRTLDSKSYAEAVSDCRWTGTENEKIIKSHTTFLIEPYSVNFIEGWLKH